ncbi:uncharacterized protein RCC_10850 [Ramularia collo-cygni]|uniref:Uncharacterized protein n=1 Tax=Ramularia collo-cygni TaxID=112498 RepID=A0A2D3VKN6_9PEZI|nr:uncharacterized protein RCC_10850 [Ramularia collo-cygni]CZT25121.1 uncharacterized protein RCC_10850 [Ramularia collo-cygni]
MGVAGSKASEIDTVENPSTVNTSKNLLAPAPGASLGTKRRHAEETALKGVKKRKGTESGSHQHISLAFRSPKPGKDSSSDGTGYGSIETSAAAPRSSKADVPPGLTLSTEHTQPEIEDSRDIILDAAADHSQAAVVSPRFQDVIRSLRDGSEDVPSGWAVVAAPPVSQSQRDHNLAMIRNAVASLNSVHLSSTYSRHNLQLSTTVIPPQNAVRNSRSSRRSSVQGSGLASLQRRSRVLNRPDPITLGVANAKRHRPDGDVEESRPHKRLRKSLVAVMHSQSNNKRHIRKLTGLWRKDDWSGWSVLG